MRVRETQNSRLLGVSVNLGFQCIFDFWQADLGNSDMIGNFRKD